jgi:hypothetical protein
MARQGNGIDQSLQSATTIDLTAFNRIAVAMWLWWDAFANDDDMALESGAALGNPTGGFAIDPNASGGTFEVFTHQSDFASRRFSRPAAGAWHQIVANLDMTVTGAAQIAAVYVDGAPQSLTDGLISAIAGTFHNATLNFLSRNNTTLFGAGRMAEPAIWGLLLSQTDATNLAINKHAPGLVQPGSLVHWWKLLGTTSPEPAEVGGVALTVNGATQTAHPPGIIYSLAAAEQLSGAMVAG